MKVLWLISILLFTTFSEGRRGRKMRKSSSLYSRIKKDLNGVEERIQGELKEIKETVTELKNITEGALLVDSQEKEEVEPEYSIQHPLSQDTGNIESKLALFSFPAHTYPTIPNGIFPYP